MRTPLLLPLISFAGCSSDIQVAGAQNTAPAAAIQSPSDGSLFLSSDAITFVGLVSDSNGLDDLATVFWNSSIDGELADTDSANVDADGLTRLSLALSPGVHAITLTATDFAGAVGEDTLEITVEPAVQEPSVIIDSPTDFFQTFPGDPVDLVGSVSDAQQSPDTLDVEWTVTDNATNDVVDSFVAPATSTGSTSATWIALGQGYYRISLTAGDEDGNATTEEVLVVVADPSLEDRDGDGFAPAFGDCDDDDATVHPDADETCGDLTDRDCNGFVDDKDLDGDGHIDDACINYTGTAPLDDCADDDPLTYGGAYELADGIDNDCDGAIDNGGTAYDDDGDCFCEVGPCTGSIEQTCYGVLADGDCDDSEVITFPGALDLPDLLGGVDHNCDGIDGDVLDSVFVDPVGGSDVNVGLDPSSPLLTLGAAYAEALTSGRDWILIAGGTLDFTGPTDDFAEGINLAGGYDGAFNRSASGIPEIELVSGGERLTGWSTPTEWQQVRVRSANAVNTGASSIVLWLDQSTGLTLNESELIAGNGMDGLDGADGADNVGGGDGGDGGDGCSNDPIGGTCSGSPTRGSQGAACSGSVSGGRGGASGFATTPGADGSDGGGTISGDGGLGAQSSFDGEDGEVGGSGADGANGTPGASVGSLHVSFGYISSDGGNGSGGYAGSGGGGGGGGGGTQIIYLIYGGAGGGGGGGGCGGYRGLGGRGGGASLGLALTQGSHVDILGGTIQSGFGGRGGTGGRGGDGGLGGLGGRGGPEAAAFLSQTGRGGDGGDGGDGGNGGHGGGGGGGPSVGAFCAGGSTVTHTGTSFLQAGGGQGGNSLGAPGASGLTVDTDGC